MLAVAVRSRGADSHRLRNVIDAQKHKIEAPRANSSRFELTGQHIAELVYDALKIGRIADRFGEFERRVWHFG